MSVKGAGTGTSRSQNARQIPVGDVFPAFGVTGWSDGFTQGKRSVAAPAMMVLTMRHTLTEVLNPAIDRFVAAGEALGFASVDTSVTPLKLYVLSASPMKQDTNFTFDIYVSVLALTVELLVEFGARAHEYTALALNMAYHIKHDLKSPAAAARGP